MDQLAFLADSPPTDRRPAGGRLTSKGIAPGDIVEVDRKGRRFHALVTSVEQRDTGRFDLGLRPLDGRSTYRTATVREVVGVWRRARGASPPPEDPGAVSRPGPAAAPGA